MQQILFISQNGIQQRYFSISLLHINQAWYLLNKNQLSCSIMFFPYYVYFDLKF